MIKPPLAILLIVAASACASDFQNGQAARAVLGQTSFSSRDAGFSPVALTLNRSYLYAADVSHRVLAFDLSSLPGPKDDTSTQQATGCPLCGFMPQSSIAQSVMPGIAAVTSFGNTVAVADPSHHRVLVWRDVTSPHAAQHPDLTLGRSAQPGSIGPDTLVEPVAVAYDGKRLFVADAALHRILVWNDLPNSEDQPANAVLGQPNFFSSLVDNTAADTLRSPVALASDGTNLYVADSADHRILVFTPGDWALSPDQVVNAASFAPGSFAPGTLVTLKVPGLTKSAAAVPEGNSDPAPRSMGGIEVYLNGVALPILAISPVSVETQLPFEISGTSAANLYVRVEHGTPSVSSAIALKIVPASPGLYAFGSHEPRTGLVMHSANDDGTVDANRPVTTESPAATGETVTLWATGLGNVDTGENSPPRAGTPFEGEAAQTILPVSATVNGRPAEVVASELPSGALGIYQVRVILPPDLPTDIEAQLSIWQNGIASNTVTFPLATR